MNIYELKIIQHAKWQLWIFIIYTLYTRILHDTQKMAIMNINDLHNVHKKWGLYILMTSGLYIIYKNMNIGDKYEY